ncbi:MAG: thiamine ABC transporter substrate binding subunit [Acidimicrobiia bacterium]
MNTRLAALACLGFFVTTAVACGDDSTQTTTSSTPLDASSTTGAGTSTITLLAYDSFTPSQSVLDAFTSSTGIAVKLVPLGDAGEMVSKAILTKDAPLGDVLFGIDNTFLSKGIEAGLFEPYAAKRLAEVPSDLTALVPDHEATPVDTGDVCVNADLAGLAARGLAVPTTLDDLIDPKYADLLVVQDPATSSPGLAFLLATRAAYGDGWLEWWKKAKANGVTVVEGWDQAYNIEFSGSSAGREAGAKRPLVVSYASSPAAEMIFADPRPSTAPTVSMSEGCFHQIEFAGVLRGTKHTAQAQQFVDFLLSDQFQSDMPGTLFVYPVVSTATLPPEFDAYAKAPSKPLTVSPDDIAANREEWIDQWTGVMRG